MPTSRDFRYEVRGTAFGRKPNVAALQALSFCGRSTIAEGPACNTDRRRNGEDAQATTRADGS